ncbi:prepilin peptidase [Candidatus Poriferisodalis sp.]|uniref:prepilin peptidase n=1 Tax=Candidatus Poriferisodalis sp. TaxID=3101277 RepID=UPI003B01BC10
MPSPAASAQQHFSARAGSEVTGAHWVGTTAVWTAAGIWALLALHAAVTDIRHRVISRRSCWAAAALIAVLLAAAAFAEAQARHLLLVAAGAAGVLITGEVLYRAKPDAIGYGDIRLINASSILTAWWGPQWPWWALALGAVISVPQAVLARVRHGSSATIAWAPALCAGTALIIANRLAVDGPVP